MCVVSTDQYARFLAGQMEKKDFIFMLTQAAAKVVCWMLLQPTPRGRAG
jgi:hypothetical protein